MHNNRTTLTRFIIEEQRHIKDATGAFSSLLNDVVTACKVISHQVNHGALQGILGQADSDNIQGERQQKLDIIANQILIAHTEWGGHCTAMASEEMEDIYPVPAAYPRGKYLLVFDPLDGSSNIETNVAVGTVFSILYYNGKKDRPEQKDFFQPGTEQVCAGYAIYGAATMIVLTTGNGVHGFTLDQNIGEFLLSHPDLRIPEDTREFAINMSNMRLWEEPVRRYVNECLQGAPGPRGKDFNMRWIASLVAEIHRILMRGGIFMYPMDERLKEKGGRLRLLYEAAPVSFLVEQAGGASTTGRKRILDMVPESLHQRVPLILGSKNEVERLIKYHRESDSE